MKYADFDIVFQEVPGEVSLALNISHCPNNCPGCHSAYLMEDVGYELNEQSLELLLDRYGRGITCVCFMGGDRTPFEVARLAEYLHSGRETPLKTAWYSGRSQLPEGFPLQWFNYVKLGPYIEAQGPLNKPSTNQHLYRVEPNLTLTDITSVFWRKNNL
ncbi:MAG: anaerobic ribonucleoside-triphosphate reductase activating protein [Bacteroidales bacterium]|nr:anaerobic ribonucleoside-triphosphate reductase activating protein [Bacteroidales bacterium]